MKKLITILFLLNLFTINIYAQDINEDGDYDIDFNYVVGPSYSIKIPTNLNITNRHSQFDYYVKGDIYADQKLHIDMQKYCTIESEKCDATISIIQEKNEFTCYELTNEYTRFTAQINHDTLLSGIYRGELSIKIYLQGEENE